jgi:hypothetical protein
MAIVKVIAMFDDRAALQAVKRRLIDAGLATEATLRVEPEELSEDLHGPRPMMSFWERLKDLLPGHDERELGAYAEGVRRGSYLLVVVVPEEQVEPVRQILERSGAIDIRKRVKRWLSAGWTAFDPATVAYTEEEVELERRCIDQETARESRGFSRSERSAAEVRLFDEGTGREIGRISEAELKVLQDALEEEGPDDNDYWINPDEIDDLACRPGATPHLIALLRRAVSSSPEGIDIVFAREDQPRQSVRRKAGAV